MSNTVPNDWEAASLRELCKFSGGSAFKEKYQGRRRGEYPFIKVSDMTIDGNQRFITNANHWIDQATKIEAKIKLFPASSVVFAKVGAALLLNRRRILTRETAIDNNMMAAIPNSDDNNFLYYVLQEVDLREIVQGGAVPSVNQAQMEDIPTLIPPLPEQQKIAAVLSSVDDVIEKTRAQIDKLKDLKTGMMQELLTKGIGSGGVPHTEFKDSPVGRIPASWAVKTVGDLGAVVTGSTPKTASREYYGGSIPFISPSDINHSMYIRKTANSLTEAGLKETRELPAGTVCVVCIGSTIGKTGITTFRCATNQQVNAVICRGTHPEFVYYLLTYYSKVIKAEAGTQAVPIINKSSFSALPVQLPGYNEQVEIGNSIASVDSQTSFLERKLQSTTSLKKALMQDLLTGKVRVKVDQKESAVA